MLKRIGGQLLRSGAGIAKDMLQGQSFGESARKRAAEGISNLLDEAPVSEQTGSGIRRTHKRKHSRAKKNKQCKKVYSDIF